jgi:hypothetical protein
VNSSIFSERRANWTEMTCGGSGSFEGNILNFKLQPRSLSAPVSLLNSGENLVFASFNVHGRMYLERKQQEILKDFNFCGVDFAALQETYMPEGRQEVDSGVFLWLGNVEKDKESRRYGLGFFVARELMASVSSATTTISNRIALLRLMLRPVDKNGKGGRHLVFVNCYAPHSWLEEVEGEEGERMGIIGESDGVVDEMWEGKEKDINPRKTTKKIQGPYTPASLSLAFSTSQGHDCTATAAAGSCTCWTGGEYVPSGGRVKKRCRQENEFSDQTSCISSEDGGVRSKRRR